MGRVDRLVRLWSGEPVLHTVRLEAGWWLVAGGWWLEDISPWPFGWRWQGPWPFATMRERVRAGPPRV